MGKCPGVWPSTGEMPLEMLLDRLLLVGTAASMGRCPWDGETVGRPGEHKACRSQSAHTRALLTWADRREPAWHRQTMRAGIRVGLGEV